MQEICHYKNDLISVRCLECTTRAPATKIVNQANHLKVVGFFVVRPAGRTYLEVKILYSPDKGKS